ncbi:MAG: hypothetical protein HY703_04495 [Gemmatimonadetes bacterium]|nr:hypothetical protein [Gemmatimonadota bacterium]
MNLVARTMILLLAAAAVTPPLASQQPHRPGAHRPAARDTAREHAEREGAAAEAGDLTRPLGLTMAREGSGTSWLPDASPMYMRHGRAGRWDVMLMGSAFLQYVDEAGRRGDSDFGVTNWVMGMARRPVGGGDLMVHGMFSVEPATAGKCGYPNLLATGEFCAGQPLHDRQHPHDLFMELAARYGRALSGDVAFELYGGPVAEPALGPVAFPHRISALSNLLAPISHHWMDATHISFGVFTAGVYGRVWKIEGSVFNGREPDAERYDFDFAALDSYSGRLWLLPGERWSIQLSGGRLTEAEFRGRGEPRRDLTRLTASASHHAPLAGGGLWAATLAWGRNIEEGEEHRTAALMLEGAPNPDSRSPRRAGDPRTDAVLLEGVLNLRERHIAFGRAELVGKTGHDLVLGEREEEVFTVGRLTAGYAFQPGRVGGLLPAMGASGSLSFVPEELEPFYGGSTRGGFTLFLSLRPAPMHTGGPARAPEHEGH